MAPTFPISLTFVQCSVRPGVVTGTDSVTRTLIVPYSTAIIQLFTRLVPAPPDFIVFVYQVAALVRIWQFGLYQNDHCNGTIITWIRLD